jgi:hypothetical protein
MSDAMQSLETTQLWKLEGARYQSWVVQMRSRGKTRSVSRARAVIPKWLAQGLAHEREARLGQMLESRSRVRCDA